MGVRMRHPDLEQEIEVAPSAVPHHQRVGWVEIEGQTEQGERWPAELQRFEGQQQIRMRHPDLEGTQITVAASAAPMHLERGWYVVPDENAPPAAPREPEAGADDQPHTPAPPAREKPSSRRRASSSSQSSKEE
ncbi:MAG TPA: hypothetical protein VG276_27885 [Actinomycetes bacterium]|jgi:hypothetical protein|nr:hypothetical protein [Actinomycetes bacterium]